MDPRKRTVNTSQKEHEESLADSIVIEEPHWSKGLMRLQPPAQRHNRLRHVAARGTECSFAKRQMMLEAIAGTLQRQHESVISYFIMSPRIN